MKAIQIRYYSATNHRPTRLKVWAEGVDGIIEPLNYSKNPADQAKELAQKFSDAMKWGKISGFGTLENGDHVATLEGSL